MYHFSRFLIFLFTYPACREQDGITTVAAFSGKNFP